MAPFFIGLNEHVKAAVGSLLLSIGALLTTDAVDREQPAPRPIGCHINQSRPAAKTAPEDQPIIIIIVLPADEIE